ncbi:Ubiquitin carboxyl-terminal hydrolase 6 [Leucoagaricus sp. SymC.cos]|nr:Ubiquitin carboxyl-terminal hydrolase 6 [Leucoagaricus sp. SymC.cos]
MAPIAVHIKHAGKTYDLQLDPDLPPAIFKDAVYQVTGVPVERMKVMVKGGVLKDDMSWKKIGPKSGQTFMVIGAAGELPKPPEKPIVFLEGLSSLPPYTTSGFTEIYGLTDMDDGELAEALAKPVGLKNLGNTCYMNSTVQALRAVPELQLALTAPALQSATPLPGALRDLYQNMGKTTDNITPMGFLSILRQVNPQFAEMDRREKSSLMMGGYAQQDAEECYSFIIQTLRNVPGLSAEGTSLATSAQAEVGNKRFVEQYFMGEMRRELTCDEAPEEPASVTTEQVHKVECNINITTNYMLSGIMNSLDQKIEKNSPSLGRQAVYSQKSRLSRLPSYLSVHMVRFAWRADINKKTKIMRKVKFPTEFDALDLATDDLKAKLLPASRKLKEVEKERAERRKVRKRTKAVATSTVTKNTPAPPAAEAAAATTATTSTDGDVTMADASSTPAEGEDKGKTVITGELEDESVYREREAREFTELVDADVKKDIGASQTGLYELVAIVTHKGAAADAGHYIAFVKKSVFHSAKGKTSPVTGATGASVELEEDDEDWYKFDDDKVSVFPKDKLATLDGGGEDSSAYVLLYRTKPLA